jgi:demethoxyubiquinone hydroxylase (CLK1/Coq7/Cat5 family)
MKELKKVNSKVAKMLMAISLIIAIATGGYFIIRSTADNETVIEKHLDKKFIEMSERISKERAEDLKEIRKQMRDLHKDGSLP